jgi:hypothetical protein
MKKFLFWFAVAKRRQAETHLIILDSVQKMFELRPKNTAIPWVRPAIRRGTRSDDRANPCLTVVIIPKIP